MWIVKIALQRSYTFIVLAIIIVLLGGYAIAKTATDIFPNIKIPVAAVIWRYTGLLPEEMANRIVLFSERIAQTTVNDVEHTESQSVNGTAVVKYFFQPDVDPDLSFAQITTVSQTQLFFAPPGTPPPFVLAHLEVATAETIALQAQLSRVNILNRYMNASVLLVKALGGGWHIDGLGQIPTSAGATAALDVAVVR